MALWHGDLNYLLAGHQVPLNCLSSEEWLVVIHKALDRVALKYLPHIRDLTKTLSTIQQWGLYNIDSSPELKIVAWKAGKKHWGIEKDVRLIPVGAVTVPPPPPRKNAYRGKDTTQPDVHLFLSTKQQWIKMERILVDKIWDQHEELCFCGLNEDELIEVVGDQRIFWPQMLYHLKTLAELSMRQKEEHIEQLGHTIRRLDEITSRVGPKFP
ncbi:MAG: hypothetical protein PHV99_00520 [Candidatus Pacebacteria bacterium]|nr:hypothetical protein [Candidatus Paceibacterota bacterium]